MIRLTGLWKSETKEGKTMLKGKLNKLNILILPNTNKNNDSQPDYSVYISDGSGVVKENQGEKNEDL